MIPAMPWQALISRKSWLRWTSDNPPSSKRGTHWPSWKRHPHLSEEVLDAPHLPVKFDTFSSSMERAAWSNAGHPDKEASAKHHLLRWRLHSLRAHLTERLGHFYEAALAQPDLPATRAALGCALARAGKFPEAAAHLAHAKAENPFDTTAARAYFGVLGERATKAANVA